MKTIIAGSRSVTKLHILHEAITACPWTITEVISGGARGADRLGELWAKANGIPLTVMRADWSRYGLRAGALRNREMANVADALIALWDMKSRGTRDMIDVANQRGLDRLVWDAGQNKLHTLRLLPWPERAK